VSQKLIRVSGVKPVAARVAAVPNGVERAGAAGLFGFDAARA
jgi:hypothetical protein